MGSTVKQALFASTMDGKKKQSIEAFLQAPFTGVYTAQSAEVVGILKDMEDTFDRNLATARDVEAKAVEGHRLFIKALRTEYGVMKKSKLSKKGELVGNDDSLGTARKTLDVAQSDLTDAEDFLESLEAMCSSKEKEYDQRVLLRANEEAALAEAISILNSDAAFEAFGKVDATSVPTFVQLGSTPKHQELADEETMRHRAESRLRGTTNSLQSGRVSKILALLAAHNPFTVVLNEIQKMIDLIADEEK